MTNFLVFLSILAGLAGLLLASNATAGVAVISFGVLLGVLARLSQASEQHRQVLKALNQSHPAPSAATIGDVVRCPHCMEVVSTSGIKPANCPLCGKGL